MADKPGRLSTRERFAFGGLLLFGAAATAFNPPLLVAYNVGGVLWFAFQVAKRHRGDDE
jgi:hypothetical protein